jgi:membrane protein
MASLKQRVGAAVERLRRRLPFVDHLLRMLAHYSAVNGNGQAGAVTYYGFLSVFPILALTVFAVGIVAQVYPDIRAQMAAEIDKLLPGVVGSGENEIDLRTIGSYSGLAGLVGLLGLLYTGLGWLSATRQALEVMFVVPRGDQPGFLNGKLRDLLTLVLLGVVLMVSVVLSGAVTGFSGRILDGIGIDPGATLPALTLGLVGHLLAIAASTVLLLTMFGLLLVESHVPRQALVRGAVLGAVGFEVLKLAANLLLTQTRGQPAFQAFGVALILLVWINYFSRLVMYSAAWAYTSPGALARRTAEATRAPGAALTADQPLEAGVVPDSQQQEQPRRRWPLVAGGAVAGAVAAVLTRGVRH